MEAKIIEENIMEYVYEKNSWLYWKKINEMCRNGKSIVGSLAGNLDKSSGYYRIMINGNFYYNHRILYQIYNNVILEPDQQIDHINRIRTDNRKENLKPVTPEQNGRNRSTPRNNKLGLKNIHINNTNGYEYYRVKIKTKSKIYNWSFRTDKFTKQEVIDFRDQKLIELHGDSASFG